MHKFRWLVDFDASTEVAPEASAAPRQFRSPAAREPWKIGMFNEEDVGYKPHISINGAKHLNIRMYSLTKLIDGWWLMA